MGDGLYSEAPGAHTVSPIASTLALLQRARRVESVDNKYLKETTYSYLQLSPSLSVPTGIFHLMLGTISHSTQTEGKFKAVLIALKVSIQSFTSLSISIVKLPFSFLSPPCSVIVN